jgi:carbon storage regulator
MLVLTRKLMEKLYIGDEICITVVRLEGGQVRLGIEAPRHIPVVRAELTAGQAMAGSPESADRTNPRLEPASTNPARRRPFRRTRPSPPGPEATP